MAAFAAFTFDRNAILSVTKQRFLFVIVPDCWSCFYRPLWGPYPLLTGFYRVLPGFTGFSLAHRGEENAERFGSWRAGFPFFFFFSIGFCFRRSLWSDFSTVSCWFSRSGGGRRVHRRLGGDALRGLDSGRTLHQSRRSRSTNHRSASVLLLFFFCFVLRRNPQSSIKRQIIWFHYGGGRNRPEIEGRAVGAVALPRPDLLLFLFFSFLFVWAIFGRHFAFVVRFCCRYYGHWTTFDNNKTIEAARFENEAASIL